VTVLLARRGPGPSAAGPRPPGRAGGDGYGPTVRRTGQGPARLRADADSVGPGLGVPAGPGTESEPPPGERARRPTRSPESRSGRSRVRAWAHVVSRGPACHTGRLSHRHGVGPKFRVGRDSRPRLLASESNSVTRQA
jgi:hypothetical protein